MTEATSFRRYLLGELDESDMEALEKELVLSDDRFRELTIEEDELIDDYWAGKLSAREMQEYREHFLVTPERRHRHRLGEAFREHVAAAAARDAPARAPEPIPKKLFVRAWRPLAAAAVVMALVGTGIWWLVQPVRLEQRTRRAEGSSVAFFLTTGTLRSLQPATEQVITVPAGVDYVELQLDLPAVTAAEHEVTLENARTDAVLAEGTLPSETIEGESVVVASIPSRLLTPGDYRVILRAPSVEGEGEGERASQRTYRFRVESP